MKPPFTAITSNKKSQKFGLENFFFTAR